MSPQNRRPDTSLLAHENPSIGRFGWASLGETTFPFSSRKDRTALTSPNGTPVCDIPHGPGFIPKNKLLTPCRANRLRYASWGTRAWSSGRETWVTGAANWSDLVADATFREHFTTRFAREEERVISTRKTIPSGQTSGLTAGSAKNNRPQAGNHTPERSRTPL